MHANKQKNEALRSNKQTNKQPPNSRYLVDKWWYTEFLRLVNSMITNGSFDDGEGDNAMTGEGVMERELVIQPFSEPFGRSFGNPARVKPSSSICVSVNQCMQQTVAAIVSEPEARSH
jgi:hypothetical protein